MKDYSDTNVGPGWAYDTPDEKEIERLNKILKNTRAELAAANERIADLERKLACARAEVVSEALSICIRLSARLSQGAGYAISFVEEELRSIASAPSGYVCVPVSDVEDAKRYRWLRDVSVPFYISVPIEFKDVRYTPQDVDKAIDAARGKS